MRAIKKGSLDQSTVIRILDSTTFLPETAVVAATAGLALSYRREGGLVVALTESNLLAADAVHADGGLIHLGSGYYRVDLPDLAVATGANGVAVFGDVTGMVIIGSYHHLVDYDPQSAVSLGLTNLDAAISTRATPAQVNVEMLDVLTVDTLIDGRTMQSAMRIIAATTAGKLSGSQTASEVFVGLDGVTTRATVTADVSGNRTSVVYS